MASESSQERARISRTSVFLWHARQNDTSALGSLLLEDPSLSSAHDYDYRTALHVASFFNCLQTASFLLRRGAPVNAQDRWGNTPLADAQTKGHHEMVKLLKENGGHMLGNHGSRLEPKAVAPPVPRSCDWEIDRLELDFSKSRVIGKVPTEAAMAMVPRKKGSFGEVRKASWRGTPVAVKTLLPSVSEDTSVLMDFWHEVELLVKLRHPNVVQFLGVVSTKPFMLITEFLRAGDLRTFLKGNGPLPAATAVSFAIDIARGMIYLHNGPNSIIHRDLKPGNILLLENNHVKVADFGLSRIFREKNLRQVYKLTGETGSYRYMAPEVFEHKSYDTKVDVFSFGVILYEMFEGAPPFTDRDSYEAAKCMARDNLRPTFRAKVYPARLKELIKKCWDGNKDERPSFTKILKHLENIMSEMQQHDGHNRKFL